jgi:hypothetical protein
LAWERALERVQALGRARAQALERARAQALERARAQALERARAQALERARCPFLSTGTFVGAQLLIGRHPKAAHSVPMTLRNQVWWSHNQRG